MPSLEEQIPLFSTAFDALERGDLDGFIEAARLQAHPEVEFHSAIGSQIGGGAFTGIEGLRSWFGDLIEITSERRWSNRSYETHGDRVIVFLADLEFTGAGSGAPVSSEVGSVFEYEEGLCVRIRSFASHD